MQARPAVHEVHVPALQTMFVPQVVPSALFAPSTHADVPVEHDVTPKLQSGSGFVVQTSPAVHETQAPELHTRSAPQVVPLGFAVPSTQTDVPVEQEVTPS